MNLPTVEIPAWIAAKYPKRCFGVSEREQQERAHRILARARQKKALPIGPCLLCGATEKIQGHHPSYDHPTRIVWLCPKCHGMVHRKNHVPINLSIRADVALAIKIFVAEHRGERCRNVSQFTENLWIAYLRSKGVKLPPMFKGNGQ